MALKWTSRAYADLVRVHEFLHPVNAAAARRVAHQLVAAAKRIRPHPRLGVRLTEFDPREVRKVLVGDYEIRYEVTDKMIFVLRIFHTREDR